MHRSGTIRLALAAGVMMAGAMVAGQAALAAPSPGDVTAGKALFQSRCQACHVIAPGAKAMIAPNLAGVVGRKAASTDFTMYSPALKKSGLTWTAATLDTFLTAPQAMVPGTRMVVQIADAKQRGQVIAYLASTGK